MNELEREWVTHLSRVREHTFFKPPSTFSFDVTPMLKRKAADLELSSGESSDDTAAAAPAVKKTNTPWAPPRLSVQSSRPFQVPDRAGLPSSRPDQVTPSSSRPKPKPGVPSHLRLPTPQGTLSLGNDSGSCKYMPKFGDNY